MHGKFHRLINKKYLTWTLFLSYYISTLFLHLKISNIIINPIETSFGTFSISQQMNSISIISCSFLFLFIIFKTSKGQNKYITIFYWFLFFASMFLTKSFILFHPNEYFHIPQYAILTILFSLCLDPDKTLIPIGRLLFWISVMGALDELNQYFFLCTQYGNYLDFNDMLLNIQGAAAGILLLYGFKTYNNPDKPFQLSLRTFYSPEVLFILICFLLLTILTCSDTLHINTAIEIPQGGIESINGKTHIFLEKKPEMFGSFLPTPSKGKYYILTPLEGMACMLAFGLLFYSFKIWIIKIRAGTIIRKS